MDRARWRFNIAKRVTPRLQLGLEINPGEEEITPNANWILQADSGQTPMISLGTSSDRIGTPRGFQSYYATFAKALPDLHAAPYLSISYSEYERKVLVPFGVNVDLNAQWSLLAMNDGRRPHALLTWSGPNSSVSLMWVWLERPGISVSYGF